MPTLLGSRAWLNERSQMESGIMRKSEKVNLRKGPLPFSELPIKVFDGRTLQLATLERDQQLAE